MSAKLALPEMDDLERILAGRVLATMNDSHLSIEDTDAARPRLWRRVVSAPEGKVLMAGIVVLFLYLVAVALTRFYSAELFHSLWTMTGTHIVGGRAAGLSWGYMHELESWVVIVANMTIETFMVLLFYPLFVFSYQKLIVIGPLKEMMARAQRAAESHRPTVRKYGIPGLLIFVWFPFWMTGPLVGCIIGFLIGLRTLTNLSVVITGTWLAILCWGIVLRRVYESMGSLGPYVPFAIVALILLFAISIRIRYAFSTHAEEPEEQQGEESSDEEGTP